MYCDADKLAEIRDKIVGLEVMELYPDWENGYIYLRLSDSLHKNTVMLKLKNNYYAGMSTLESAKFYSNKSADDKMDGEK